MIADLMAKIQAGLEQDENKMDENKFSGTFNSAFKNSNKGSGGSITQEEREKMIADLMAKIQAGLEQDENKGRDPRKNYGLDEDKNMMDAMIEAATTQFCHDVATGNDE